MAAKILSSLLVVGVAGSLVASAVFSAFSSQTINEANTFSAGTVTISDNRGASALYSVTNAKPGVTTTGCIKVTYGGSIGSVPVKLFTDSTVTAGAQYVNLKITRGTGASVTCSDFVADTTAGAVAFNGTIQGFAAARNSYANGLDGKEAAGTWNTSEAKTYKFEVVLQDTNLAQGATTGAHRFIWEARDS